MKLGGPRRFEHQRRALSKLISTGGVAAVLHDPGLGKTAATIDYASMLAAKYGEARVLVVVPLGGVDSWVSQVPKFVSPEVNYWAEVLGGSIRERAEALASRGGQPFRRLGSPAAPRGVKDPPPRGQHLHRSLVFESSTGGRTGPETVPGPRLVLEVINLDTLALRSTVQGSRKSLADWMLEGVKRFDPHLVVVDESHRIKGPSANASRLLGRIGEHVPRRVILTGTVMPLGPLDVWAQWRFLDPYAFGFTDSRGVLRKSTYGAFKNRFAVLGGFMGKEVVGYQNLDELRRIMASNATVAKKADALDLPPVTEAVVPVTLSAKEKKAYSSMISDLRADLDSGQVSAGNQLVKLLRLRQITAGFVTADDGSIVELGSSKRDVIRSLVHDTLAGENRIVVFALFSHEIDRLADELAAEGTTVEVIRGETPAAERLAIRQRFADTSGHPERIVLVAQVKTMSLAVNELVTASHCIFASLSQQRDDVVQARDRLDRLGQTKPVTVWVTEVARSVDEAIWKAHLERTDLEGSLLRHVRDFNQQ